MSMRRHCLIWYMPYEEKFLSFSALYLAQSTNKQARNHKIEAPSKGPPIGYLCCDLLLSAERRKVCQNLVRHLVFEDLNDERLVSCWQSSSETVSALLRPNWQRFLEADFSVLQNTQTTGTKTARWNGRHGVSQQDKGDVSQPRERKDCLKNGAIWTIKLSCDGTVTLCEKQQRTLRRQATTCAAANSAITSIFDRISAATRRTDDCL